MDSQPASHGVHTGLGLTMRGQHEWPPTTFNSPNKMSGDCQSPNFWAKLFNSPPRTCVWSLVKTSEFFSIVSQSVPLFSALLATQKPEPPLYQVMNLMWYWSVQFIKDREREGEKQSVYEWLWIRIHLHQSKAAEAAAEAAAGQPNQPARHEHKSPASSVW